MSASSAATSLADGHGPRRRAALADELDRLAQDRPDVADDPERGRHAAPQLGGLDVDLDVGGVRRRDAAGLPVRLHLLKRVPRPTTTSASSRRRFESRLRCAPSPPAASGWSSGNVPRPDRLVGTGVPVSSASSRSSACAPAIVGAAAGDEDRSLRGEQPVDELGDLVRVALRPRWRSGGAVGERDLLAEDVARDVDVDRAGTPAAGLRERLVEHLRHELGAVDADRPLRDRLEHAIGRDLLARTALGRRAEPAAREDHHRQAADVGLGDGGQEVRRAGAGRGDADAGLTVSCA